MSRRAVVAAAGTAAVLAVAGVVALLGGGSDAQAPGGAPVSGTVETVARRDLVERITADGTLGYRGERTTTGQLPGTLTWVPGEGEVVRSGERLYAVDGEPVLLLRGSTPAWRDLGPATGDGADVAQLQRALGVEADGAWDSETTEAVTELQERHGLEETGTLERGRVVFLPGARRVASVAATLGGPATGPIVTTTSTRPGVDVRLDAADQALAEVGAEVEVALPDGQRVRGRIAGVGTVARAAEAEGGAATLEVDVRLTGRRARGVRLDGAPVSVDLERSRREDVLAVPATALIGIAGGGYAVQTPDGRRIEVEPGLFADGFVEVEGAGLREGQRIVVPA